MPAYPVCCKPPEESIHTFNIGHFLWEKIRLEELCVPKELTEALTEGLSALTRQGEVGVFHTTRATKPHELWMNNVLCFLHLQTRPLEFLAVFLTRWSEKKEGGGESSGEERGRNKGHDSSLAPLGLISEQPQVCVCVCVCARVIDG